MEKGRYLISAEVEVTGTLPTGNVEIVLPGGRPSTVKPGEFKFELREPAEPPHNAVVIDRDGDAWQNNFGDWSMAGASSYGDLYDRPWSTVLKYGPVKVVHVPGQDAPTP